MDLFQFAQYNHVYVIIDTPEEKTLTITVNHSPCGTIVHTIHPGTRMDMIVEDIKSHHVGCEIR